METFAETISRHTVIRYSERAKAYYGICPFCKKETFKVRPKENTFICYACGQKGTKNDFMGKFSERQEPYAGRSANAIKLRINEEAATFFFKKLREGDNPGLTYLKKEREMTDDQMEIFGLGYAPSEYNALYKELSMNYADEELLESGLFRKNEKGYINDFFRNRVIFPIIGEDGNVIAFGGRALNNESQPKYLNSPESELFAKRRELYGYPYFLKNKGKELIICEGYMDLVALQYAGFSNSCAVLGTALTSEHVKKIKKDYDRVILSLDSDLPGINAARKSIKVLEEAGIEARILNLSPAKDPDEFLKKHTKEHLQNRIVMGIPQDSFLARNGDISTLISILERQAI